MKAADLSTEEIKKLAQQHLLNVYPLALDIVFERGEGNKVFDSEGRSYLDFATGIGVNILGYGNSTVLNAIRDQIVRGIHSSNLYLNKPQVLLARKLAETSGLPRVFLGNSGAEANEAAIKIARAYGNSRKPAAAEIICFENGWHGRTMAAISATGATDMQRGFEPLLPGFKIVPTFNLKAIEDAIGPSTIAVMFEPILGHGGVLPAPAGFMRKVRELCERTSTLMILDEVQTGLGRTGTLFRYQSEGILPDILTLAKGLAGGVPIGAALCSEELAAVLGPGSHGSTFGGNPLAASAALAVLSEVSSGEFLDRVRERGELWKQSLAMIARDFPNVISEVRAVGLMSAIVVKCDRNRLARMLAAKGLLSTTMRPDCVRFLPPLTVEQAEIEQATAILASACSEF